MPGVKKKRATVLSLFKILHLFKIPYYTIGANVINFTENDKPNTYSTMLTRNDDTKTEI